MGAAETAESMAPDLANQDLFSKISHLGIQALPVFFPIFSMLYHTANIGAAGPAMAVALADPRPGRDRCRHERRTSPFWRGYGSSVAIRPGVGLRARAALLIFTAYLYLMIVAATVILGAGCRQEPGPYRRQVVIVPSPRRSWLAIVLLPLRRQPSRALTGRLLRLR